MKMAELQKVFVYGTLKRGQPNHHWLLNPNNGIGKFKTEAHTVDRYPLIIGTKYNIPFLLDSKGKGHNVKGEIYETDEKMLLNLDILEDHPSFYTRRLEKVNTLDGGLETCWIYFLPRFRPELLNKEMFQSYDSNGSHNSKYCERYLRDPSYNHKDDVC